MISSLPPTSAKSSCAPRSCTCSNTAMMKVTTWSQPSGPQKVVVPAAPPLANSSAGGPSPYTTTPSPAASYSATGMPTPLQTTAPAYAAPPAVAHNIAATWHLCQQRVHNGVAASCTRVEHTAWCQ
eukprot:14972377-Ditylum_brightwellii.AAC.1